MCAQHEHLAIPKNSPSLPARSLFPVKLGRPQHTEVTHYKVSWGWNRVISSQARRPATSMESPFSQQSLNGAILPKVVNLHMLRATLPFQTARTQSHRISTSPLQLSRHSRNVSHRADLWRMENTAREVFRCGYLQLPNCSPTRPSPNPNPREHIQHSSCTGPCANAMISHQDSESGRPLSDWIYKRNTKNGCDIS